MVKMTKMTIVGIDWSLNCPCACILAEDATFAKSKFCFLSSKKRDTEPRRGNITGLEILDYTTEEQRYNQNTGLLLHWIYENLPDPNKIKPVFYLEGYSMGSKGLVFNIAECTGLLKHKLFMSKAEVVIVPPTTMKKFATGKGNSDKARMYEVFREKGNPDLISIYYTKPNVKVGSPVTDIVDAYFLALYGREQITPRHSSA